MDGFFKKAHQHWVCYTSLMYQWRRKHLLSVFLYLAGILTQNKTHGMGRQHMLGVLDLLRAQLQRATHKYMKIMCTLTWNKRAWHTSCLCCPPFFSHKLNAIFRCGLHRADAKAEGPAPWDGEYLRHVHLLGQDEPWCAWRVLQLHFTWPFCCTLDEYAYALNFLVVFRIR